MTFTPLLVLSFATEIKGETEVSFIHSTFSFLCNATQI